MGEKLRNSGIKVIGDTSLGTNFCQFYQVKENLMEGLLSYFKVELENYDHF